MEGKKYKGKAKGVPNAGVVILHGPVGKDGIAQEKTIIFNGITVPMPGDLNKVDEPFAFEAKEFIRKMIIGKEVEFFIDAKIHDREFGRVVYQGEDVAVLLLGEGLGKLMENLKSKPVNFDKYSEAQASAQKAGKGIWATGGSEIQKTKVRKISKIEDPLKFLEKIKGTKYNGIVEEFRTGPFKIYCAQLDTIIPVSLSGLMTPIINAKAALDYRMFVEFHFLSRDVTFTILSYDEKYQTFVGYITLVDQPLYDISKELLTYGFAKLNFNAAVELDLDHFKALKALQEEAQSKQLRIWVDYKSEKKTISAGSQGANKEFVAKVLEVHSGDSITVENLTKYEILRVYLANIRAPQMGNPRRNEADQPWAYEAKEFLRKNCIGNI